ncbi:MAG TPA: putative metalloprotease CJM1_0395 family protein [Arenimonas sp.]|nr:putative metalloprotease CJM1_0395 family protein [Arenimonas sp.]
MQIAFNSSAISSSRPAPVSPGNADIAAGPADPVARPGEPADREATTRPGTAPAAARTGSSEPTQREDPLDDPRVRAQLAELKATDAAVRAHEAAHLAAAGSHATSGPSYSYERGPDGRRYAVGGEVGIDTSPVRGDPEATIAKARQVERAALAPAEPSGQDLRIAAAARATAQQAQLELAQQQRAEAYASNDERGQTPVAGLLLSATA